MAAAVRDAVLGTFGESAVGGIYFKGSAQRLWRNRLDYAPEVSDVDIHVDLRDEDRLDAFLATPENGLDLAATTEDAFRRACPDALHLPRPQLIFLNVIKRLPGYVPSHPDNVTCLYGGPYPVAYEHPGNEALRAGDRERLREACARVDAKLTDRVMDRPGRFLWDVVRDFSWRISPTGPRLLSLAGDDPLEVWRLRRSEVHERMGAHPSLAALADDYAGFYRHAWDWFLAGWTDGAPGRAMVRHAVGLLTRARALIADREQPATEIRTPALGSPPNRGSIDHP